jgi:hypothetical protein
MALFSGSLKLIVIIKKKKKKKSQAFFQNCYINDFLTQLSVFGTVAKIIFIVVLFCFILNLGIVNIIMFNTSNCIQYFQ